jgi:hypothetical protein
MKTFLSLIGRVAAVFGSSALAAVAGGAVFGVELWKSAAIAGVMSAAKVTESLLKSYADDGVLDKEEISQAFGGNNSMTTAKKARRKAPTEQV